VDAKNTTERGDQLGLNGDRIDARHRARVGSRQPVVSEWRARDATFGTADAGHAWEAGRRRDSARQTSTPRSGSTSVARTSTHST